MIIDNVFNAAKQEFQDNLLCVYFTRSDGYVVVYFPSYENLLISSNIKGFDYAEIGKDYNWSIDIRTLIGFCGVHFGGSYLADVDAALAAKMLRVNKKYEKSLVKLLISFKKSDMAAMRSYLVELMENFYHFQRNDNINPQIDYLSLLSKTEQKAFSALKKYLGSNEGNLSITRLCAETEISRPVYKNLFIKLEKVGILEVKNQGVNGTYIKIKE